MKPRTLKLAAPQGLKPPVHGQGKAIVELGGGGSPFRSDLVVMMPDGSVTMTDTPAHALKALEPVFDENTNVKAINVGMIEWRDNIQPPKETKR